MGGSVADEGRSRRILALDVTRGLMLLLVAVANSVSYWGISDGPDAPAIASTADAALAVFEGMAVHGRAYPLFMIVFGVGAALLDESLQRRHGPWADQRPLRVRYRWLAVIGAVHLVLLNLVDVVLLYGLVGAALVVPRLRRSPAEHRRTIVTTLVLLAMCYALYVALSPWIGAEEGIGGLDPRNYLLDQVAVGTAGAVALRFLHWLSAPLVLPMMLLGVMAVQAGLLKDTPAARATLRRVATVGLPVAWVGGVPAGLVDLGVVPEGWPAALALTVADLTGLVGGAAYGAVIVLVCRRWQRRLDDGGTARALPLAVRWLAALGRRSLSGYVAQSMIFLPLATPYGLGLLTDASVTVATAFGVGVWLVTLAVAALLERAGWRGPLEALHRTLTARRVATIDRS